MKLASFIQEEASREDEFHRRMAEHEHERRMGLDKARNSMFPHLRGGEPGRLYQMAEGLRRCGQHPHSLLQLPIQPVGLVLCSKERFRTGALVWGGFN